MQDSLNINPDNVRKVLGKHLLTDGYDMVLDLKKSKGAYLYDSKSGKRYLDFFTFFASKPFSLPIP
jgi:L-lysine 6-transaminase